MKVNITIDKKELVKLSKDSKNLLFDDNASEALRKLLEIQDAVNEAVDQVKQEILERCLEVDPSFKSLKSDHFTFSYREFGDKYLVDKYLIDQIDKKYYKVVEKITPNTKNIDDELEKTGKLPKGISFPIRKKSLVIRKNENKS